MLTETMIKENQTLTKIEDLTKDLSFYSSATENSLMSAEWECDERNYSRLAYCGILFVNFIKKTFDIGYVETVKEIFNPYIRGDYNQIHILNSIKSENVLSSQYEALYNQLVQFKYLNCIIESAEGYVKTQFFNIIFGNTLNELKSLRVRIVKK